MNCIKYAVIPSRSAKEVFIVKMSFVEICLVKSIRNQIDRSQIEDSRWWIMVNKLLTWSLLLTNWLEIITLSKQWLKILLRFFSSNFVNGLAITSLPSKFFNIAKMMDDDAWKIIFLARWPCMSTVCCFSIRNSR